MVILDIRCFASFASRVNFKRRINQVLDTVDVVLALHVRWMLVDPLLSSEFDTVTSIESFLVLSCPAQHVCKVLSSAELLVPCA